MATVVKEEFLHFDAFGDLEYLERPGAMREQWNPMIGSVHSSGSI
jgi:hypothetical protein